MSRFNTLTAKFTRVFGSGVHDGKSRFNAGAKPLVSSSRALISPENQILSAGLMPMVANLSSAESSGDENP